MKTPLQNDQQKKRHQDQAMDLRTFDLNLLLVLDALLKERSVTGAGVRLNLSQPTVSSALNKLRTLFQDELFVRGAKGVEPTPRARELEDAVSAVLVMVQEQVLHKCSFDAATTNRTFVLIGGEIGQMVFIHQILLKLQAVAPLAAFKFIFPDPHDCASALEDGRADLAIGYFPQFLKANLFQQRLYSRPLLCIARTDHPALRDGPLTMEKFCGLGHAIIASQCNLDELVEHELRRLGYRRDVRVELAHSAAAPHLLLHTDLIAVVPEALATLYVRDGKLATWPLPFDLPNVEVRQFWHRTYNGDPGLTWLRQYVATAFHAFDKLAPGPVMAPTLAQGGTRRRGNGECPKIS